MAQRPVHATHAALNQELLHMAARKLGQSHRQKLVQPLPLLSGRNPTDPQLVLGVVDLAGERQHIVVVRAGGSR